MNIQPYCARRMTKLLVWISEILVPTEDRGRNNTYSSTRHISFIPHASHHLTHSKHFNPLQATPSTSKIQFPISQPPSQWEVPTRLTDSPSKLRHLDTFRSQVTGHRSQVTGGILTVQYNTVQYRVLHSDSRQHRPVLLVLTNSDDYSVLYTVQYNLNENPTPLIARPHNAHSTSNRRLHPSHLRFVSDRIPSGISPSIIWIQSVIRRECSTEYIVQRPLEIPILGLPLNLLE